MKDNQQNAESKLEQAVKPPIGILTEWMHKELRIDEINDAIERYNERNYSVPAEWINERTELLKWLQLHLPTSPYLKGQSLTTPAGNAVDGQMKYFAEWIGKGFEMKAVGDNWSCFSEEYCDKYNFMLDELYPTKVLVETFLFQELPTPSKPHTVEEDRETKRQPIEDALYATKRYLTTEATDLADVILDYLIDHGFTIIKQPSKPRVLVEGYPINKWTIYIDEHKEGTILSVFKNNECQILGEPHNDFKSAIKSLIKSEEETVEEGQTQEPVDELAEKYADKVIELGWRDNPDKDVIIADFKAGYAASLPQSSEGINKKMKEAIEIWDACRLSTVNNSSIEHDHVRDIEFVEFDYSVIKKDQQQYFKQKFNIDL